MTGSGQRAPDVARIHDYLLGGKDNYAWDRQFADSLLAVMPDARAGSSWAVPSGFSPGKRASGSSSPSARGIRPPPVSTRWRRIAARRPARHRGWCTSITTRWW